MNLDYHKQIKERLTEEKKNIIYRSEMVDSAQVGMVDSAQGGMVDPMLAMLRDVQFRDKMNRDDLAHQKLETLRKAAREEGQQIAIPKLYRAAMGGEWKQALRQFRYNQNAKTAKISNLGMTALHVAASCGQSEFVQKLVKKLDDKQLEARDQLGRTALHHVALAANVDAAKAMVNKNKNLPYLGDLNNHTPIFYAAKWRKPSERKKMVEYLYQVSRDENLPLDLEGRDLCNAFTDASAPDLIVAITASGSYDTALHILQRYPELALKKNTEEMSILHVLAIKPKAFWNGNKLSPLISWMYDLVPVDTEETEHEDSASDGAKSKNPCSAASFFKYMSKFIKGVREIKQSHLRAVTLVKFICHKLKEMEMDFVQDFFIPENSTAILHLAVEHGVFELVDECLKAFPDLIWYADKPPKVEGSVQPRHAHYTSKVVGRLLWNDATQHEHASTSTAKLYHHGTEYADTTSGHWEWHEGHYADTATGTGRLLLHVAIEHRQVEIFNYLIAYIGNNTKAYADLKLEGNNNSLHLAAKLAPTPQLQSVPGPAFQMQRELQWFKAVEELVYDELKTQKNLDDKTPEELFSDTHQKLQKKAKEWTKDLSNSCMVVATLVATVAFAAMITLPGGSDDTGMPVLARKKKFTVFSISNALSMISSAVSLLMFLSVQTSSRYTEDDFLELLPKILLGGLVSLSIAVITMMISFATSIGLSLQSRHKWAYIPITIVACFPAIIFFSLHLPLLLRTVLFHSRPGILGGYRLLADDMA